MAAHPAYRQIVEMGERAIPFLLCELTERADHWFVALHKITVADPVPEKDRGNIRAMAKAWIQWGKEQGYNLNVLHND